MALTPLPNQNTLPAEGGVSPFIPSTVPADDAITEAAEETDQAQAFQTTSSIVALPPPLDLPGLAGHAEAPSAPSITGRDAILGTPDGSLLPGPPGSSAAPEDYVEIFKNEAVKKSEENERQHQDAWVNRSIQEIGFVYDLLAGGDGAWKNIRLPAGVEQGAARRTAVVDAYMRVFLREATIPNDEFHRNLLRFHVSHLMFNGRGAESDEAFLGEIKKDRAFLSRKATPEIDGRIGLHEHLTMLARQSALPGRASPYPLEIPPAPDTGEEKDPLMEQFSRIAKRIRVYGPDALGRGQKTMDDLVRFAQGGRIFEPNWRDENAYAAYTSLRDAAAVDYGLGTDEIDDVIRHRLDAQKKDVSRDAFGEVHFKNQLVIQGVDAMRKAVADSDLTPLEKERQMDKLPERYEQFRESLVASVMKDMPELAAELGVKSVADYDKITAVLNDGAWKQGAGGLFAAADGSMSSLDSGLGIVEGWFRDEGSVPYMKKRAKEVGRRSAANHQINALSQLFYKEKTSFLGVDAALIGQGVWSGLESAALVTVTAPLAPQIAVARYGRLAVAFNAAAKVAPAAGIFGVRQGFATYDQAIAAGKSPAEATRLAWCSGLIEGATTVAFSAIPGAGGLESITAGSMREAFRRTLGESVRSAWKEGAKAFGKGVLGEMGEEELIAALDTAFVQTQIEPGMTGAQFMKRLYDTAITTAFASGGFSAAHGRNVYKDTLANNDRTPVSELGAVLEATPPNAILDDPSVQKPATRRSPPNPPDNPYRNTEGNLPTTPYHRSANDPDLAEKEAEFNGILAGPIERADAAYDAVPETRGGKVIGTDLAREVFPHYRTPAGRARYTGITTTTASQYAKDRVWREIHDKGDRQSLLWTAGGPASGKSTVITDKLIAEHDLIYDGTMRDLEWAKNNLEAAERQGWDSTIVWVGRPMKLLAIGAVKRSVSEGRAFALADLPDAHHSAQQTVITLAKHFEGNPAVDFRFFFNGGATRDVQAQKLTLEQIDNGGKYSYDNDHGTDPGGTKESARRSDGQSGLERFRAATREDIVGVFRDAVAGRITVEGKGPSHELLVQLAGRDEELQRILKESGK